MHLFEMLLLVSMSTLNMAFISVVADWPVELRLLTLQHMFIDSPTCICIKKEMCARVIVISHEKLASSNVS